MSKVLSTDDLSLCILYCSKQRHTTHQTHKTEIWGSFHPPLLSNPLQPVSYQILLQTTSSLYSHCTILTQILLISSINHCNFLLRAFTHYSGTIHSLFRYYSNFFCICQNSYKNYIGYYRRKNESTERTSQRVAQLLLRRARIQIQAVYPQSLWS